MEWDTIGVGLSNSCASKYVNRDAARIFNEYNQIQSITAAVLTDDGNGFGDGFLNRQHTTAINVVKALGGFKFKLVYQTT